MTEFYVSLFSLFIAVTFAFVAGLVASRLTMFATDQMAPEGPTGMDPETWRRIVDAKRSGIWVGMLERLIALAAVWLGSIALVVGWLAFKVAAKWESWRNITQVPISLEGISDIEYLRARSEWSTWALGRFLIGTGSNVLIGLLAGSLGLFIKGFLGAA